MDDPQNAENGTEPAIPTTSPREEKPLPHPPKEVTWSTEAVPHAALVSTPSPAPAPPRLKKKVPWRGKNIMVLLPWDDERGQKGKAPTPMTTKDVEAMLRDWEQLGYDTRGFNLGERSNDDYGGAEGQSRATWPQELDMIAERDQRPYNIRIPDKKQWDAYVNELSEAKLRALGVSFGDDEGMASTASTMSRQTSTQYPALPFSPPVPTASAASTHLSHQANPFSPTILAGAGLSTSQSSNPGSIASPASMQAHMHGKFNPRQSVSFSAGEHPFGSPFQYPQQPSPGVWSPAQMLYQQGTARGGSPAIQNLGSIVSPISPFGGDGYFQQGDVLSQLQQRQQHLQAQLQHLQTGPRASPRLQEVLESPDEEQVSKSPSKTPEARQIKHNPSASLQKEIDEAEYHLEEQFQRQLEHDDYSPHSEQNGAQLQNGDSSHARNASLINNQSAVSARFDVDSSGEGPVLHHPQPHSRGHSLSQRPFQDSEESSAESKLAQPVTQTDNAEGSDFETNPSLSGTPALDGKPTGAHQRSVSIISNPWQDSDDGSKAQAPASKRPGHVSKLSMSGLNVGAKEFKFNPSNSFTPTQYSFGGSSFQPPPITAYASFAPPQPTFGHQSRPSVSTGKINVAAPVFTPGNSEFSFSSSGPSFRPDAPVFTPSVNSNNKFSESVGSTGSGSEDPLRTSIFGNIDLSALGISKPPKKNKAVPIIRPDSSSPRNLDDEVMEDEGGRIVQNSDRVKRARGEKADGDSVPLFAEPGMPLNETAREQSPPKQNVPVLPTQADKENSAPLGSPEQDAIPKVPAKLPTPVEDSPSSAGKEFAPWEFQQQKQAEDFNAARPFTARRYGSGLPAYGQYEDSEQEHAIAPEPVKEEPKKSHTKNSLSATAKPFEFKPGAYSFTFGEPSVPTSQPVDPPAPKGLAASKWATEASPVKSTESEDDVAPPRPGLSGSRFARTPSPEPVKPVPRVNLGLSGSRYARSPTPEQAQDSSTHDLLPDEMHHFQAALPQPQSPPRYEESEPPTPSREELDLAAIDDIMDHLNAQDQQVAPRNDIESSPQYHQPSPARRIQVPDLDNSSPIRLQPQNLMRSDAPSPSPGRFRFSPSQQQQRIFSRGVENDPFTGEARPILEYGSPIHRLNNGSSIPASDWDDMIDETEESRFQHRAQFFDSHVNELVGGLLEDRLIPLEKTLETIQLSLSMMASRAPSSRRERRSVSGALSDADDEDDDELLPRRSLSPRRDKKMEKIRSIINEALNAHHSRPQTATSSSATPNSNEVLQALQEMKEQFGASMRLDFRAEDLRNVVEEAVEKRMPSPKPTVDESALARDAEQKSRIEELELRLAKAESTTEQEINTRRAAEDRLAEVQRLLRISSEEEDRLREAMDKREISIQKIIDERDQKVRGAEESRSKTAMRVALMEAAHDNTKKSVSDAEARFNRSEQELREAKQQVHHWKLEAERALDAARRHSEDAEQANDTNKELRRTLDSTKTQMEESIRVREAMRGKLIGLQEEMASAARNISDENARRFKKEQELVARQEVLDARLQAEARTRERLEQEIERLEAGERDGMRAVSECKRLEALVLELKNETHLAEKDAMRYQREFEEARESGLSEVARTRNYLQAEVEAANNQVNVVRDDLEQQISFLRSQMDQVKLDADSSHERSEMLLEEAQTSKAKAIEELKRKHADEVDDMQARYERQIGNSSEDAQRSEQHLLERLSLSSAKTEHLQDRVAHLEEKLEIANQAATAAAQAAKTARSGSITSQPSRKLSKAAELPEKISPQALRESIMVLQEQLQDREQNIEKLEAQVAELDPDAVNKISKRDDEILWLRELLAVRKSDLTDIVIALEGEEWDGDRVKDAAIRLRASLQMEEQEHERAMNGGSAINLPNIAASIRDAASPRVAQAVGPLAAAWGNWRKGRENSGSISENIRERSGSSTPSRSVLASPGGGSFLGGLLTPPASSARTPGGSVIPSNRRTSSQPTAFGSVGQRFTREQLANRPAPVRSMKGKEVVRTAERERERPIPTTPPMMRKSSYDADATAGDFSDAGFYDDDESTVDGYQGR